jgi:hypothetical protein
MKKHTFAVFSRLFFVCIILALGGCMNAATPIPYTSPAPAGKLCTLKIISTLTVTEFDGAQVKWSPSFGDSWSSVQVSEGRHTFRLDYNRSAGTQGGSLYRSGITVSYDGFVAGHTYEMVAAAGAEAGGFSGLFTNPLGAMRDTSNKTLRIGIRDITNGQEGDFTWLQWQ